MAPTWFLSSTLLPFFLSGSPLLTPNVSEKGTLILKRPFRNLDRPGMRQLDPLNFPGLSPQPTPSKKNSDPRSPEDPVREISEYPQSPTSGV